MPTTDLTSALSLAISGENSTAIIIFGISIFIFLILIIYALARKLIVGEKLKYEFITIIAHKFRTPLTHVKWSSDELVKNEQDPYKKQSLIDIQQSNEKLIKLTGTLIELTDKDSTTASSYSIERVSLCSFVRTVCDAYKDAFHEKNIFFSVQCPANDIFVKIDVARMEFVLQTLLENALTYTPTGKNVEVNVTRSHRKAHVAVTDHGIGIDNSDMNNIFGKFYRAQNARAVDTEGFGVGLYLAQAVTKRHRGKIEAYSAGIGSGATFTLTLKAVR
jgi:signal transduction histidine kinase